MKRERITITIDTDLLPAVDKLIDKETIRNRSHALEYAVRRGLALQELTSVFFIQGEKILNPEVTEKLAHLCGQFPLRAVYGIATTAQAASAQLWQQSFAQHLSNQVESRLLPADFGTATALLLEKETVSPLFLLINLDRVITLPENLLPSFTFHLQQNATLTHLVETNGTTFTPSGISIVSKEILSSIPAGRAELEGNVFPLLAKLGKVSTYVYSL